MPYDEPPADSNVVTRTGPWTVLSCVTASCTWCGQAPLDEDTRLTLHFTDIAQAREELTRDWGWTLTSRSNWPKDDELLCPGCAKADGRMTQVGNESAIRRARDAASAVSDRPAR